MSKSEEYEKQTEALLQPILDENHFELVDVEYVKEAGNWFLRAYIDKEGGITVNDCELVSRALDVKLDEKDFIDEAYILEVSSPGLGRPLKKERDYQRSIGEEIEIKLFAPLNGTKEFKGFLSAYDKETVVISLEEEENAEKTISIPRKNIALIRLALDF